MPFWAEDSERRTSTEHQRGKAQVRAAYEALYARNAALRLFNEHRRVAQRTTVVCEGGTAGVHRATGRSFTLPIVAIVDFTPSGLVRSAHPGLEISHRLYVMGHGRIVFEGPPPSWPPTKRSEESVWKCDHPERRTRA